MEYCIINIQLLKVYEKINGQARVVPRTVCRWKLYPTTPYMMGYVKNTPPTPVFFYYFLHNIVLVTYIRVYYHTKYQYDSTNSLQVKCLWLRTDGRSDIAKLYEYRKNFGTLKRRTVLLRSFDLCIDSYCWSQSLLVKCPCRSWNERIKFSHNQCSRPAGQSVLKMDKKC